MKIGILTQPLQSNYGGLLQNYALQQVLKGMGHKVETVNWQPARGLKEWLWQQKKQLLYLIHKEKERPRYQLTTSETAVVAQHTNHFIGHYLSVCPYKVEHQKEFAMVDIKRSYDAYIVGSDQVWRPSYNPFQTAMYLDFVERPDVKKIAYAASFGISSWELPQQMTADCAMLIKRFDMVTVREKSGIKLCNEYLGVEAIQVLDPTMLLDREDYEKIVDEENEPQSAGTLFHYILDPCEEKKLVIDDIAVQLGLLPFTIMPKCQAENRTKWDVKYRINDCVFSSVTSWLRGFMDAEMVVVDSFHGAVFSIIFNKPFWVIGNSKRGNGRFESLLGIFGLENRMITPGQMVKWNDKIDWKRINAIRDQEKTRCVNLLKNVLK